MKFNYEVIWENLGRYLLCAVYSEFTQIIFNKSKTGKDMISLPVFCLHFFLEILHANSLIHGKKKSFNLHDPGIQ